MTPIIQHSSLFLVIAAALTMSGALTSAGAETLELNCHSGRTGAITSGIKVWADGDISTRQKEEDVWVKVDNAAGKAARWSKALDSINFARLARLDRPFGRHRRDTPYCRLERSYDVTFSERKLEGPFKPKAKRTILRIFNELEKYQPKP
jgi:hypothetical protein